MVADVNWAYCGDHSAIYTHIELLCCIAVTNIMLSIIFQFKKILDKERKPNLLKMEMNK